VGMTVLSIWDMTRGSDPALGKDTLRAEVSGGGGHASDPGTEHLHIGHVQDSSSSSDGSGDQGFCARDPARHRLV